MVCLLRIAPMASEKLAKLYSLANSFSEACNMKYIVGFENNGKFYILYKTNNARLAMLMVKKLQAKRKEEIKIKKS